MSYAHIEFDHSRFIRCNRCGVLKQRTYKRQLTQVEVDVLLECRDYTGFGYIKLSKYLNIHICTVQRIVRNYERNRQHLCTV